MVIPLDTLNLNDRSPRMSSREIAKLTGIAHNEVKRMVKSLETTQRLSQPVQRALVPSRVCSRCNSSAVRRACAKVLMQKAYCGWHGSG